MGRVRAMATLLDRPTRYCRLLAMLGPIYFFVMILNAPVPVESAMVGRLLLQMQVTVLDKPETVAVQALTVILLLLAPMQIHDPTRRVPCSRGGMRSRLTVQQSIWLGNLLRN